MKTRREFIQTVSSIVVAGATGAGSALLASDVTRVFIKRVSVVPTENGRKKVQYADWKGAPKQSIIYGDWVAAVSSDVDLIEIFRAGGWHAENGSGYTLLIDNKYPRATWRKSVGEPEACFDISISFPTYMLDPTAYISQWFGSMPSSLLAGNRVLVSGPVDAMLLHCAATCRLWYQQKFLADVREILHLTS